MQVKKLIRCHLSRCKTYTKGTTFKGDNHVMRLSKEEENVEEIERGSRFTILGDKKVDIDCDNDYVDS